MNAIKTMFKAIDYPVWIKNKQNQIVFLNDTFQKRFILGEFSPSEETQIEQLISCILLHNKKTTHNIKINNILYNHIIFSIGTNHQLIGMLVEVEEPKEITTIPYDKHILKTVIDNIPELIFYKDKDLKYMGLNKECVKFYENLGVHEVIGKNDLELPLDSNFTKQCHEHDLKVLESKQPLYIEETSNGITFETIKTPIIGEDGEIAGLVGVVRDISDYKKKEEMLRYLGYTDGLTKLYNRTYFDQKILELLEEKRYPIGLILGDMDGLKIVNDSLGHLEGDKLLKCMADILKNACEDEGIVFRWGGDEFVVLLPGCEENKCIDIINKINDLCHNTNCDQFELSISQGYSMLNEGDSIDKVLVDAENKVYRQKMLNNSEVRNSILNNLRSNLQDKNVETQIHTDRVSVYCTKLGEALELEADEIEKASLIGRLHDIGKIGIPDDILLKPGKLTNKEYEIMKTHSEKGYRIAGLLPELSPVSREILTHHERWDGNGYPLGLKGEEIPLLSRIVTIADSFDAMTHDRPYSKGRSVTDAIEELQKCAGSQFDPKIVNVFVDIIKH